MGPPSCKGLQMAPKLAQIQPNADQSGIGPWLIKPKVEGRKLEGHLYPSLVHSKVHCRGSSAFIKNGM